ncbi:MAG: hypothetical protein BGO45_04490 [Microbacterium sp. 71-36]|uniref:TetR/AcrR family transcriptional regulator n=3 Tax=Microbacterium TaxID=33882 RepID=UPI00092BA9C6|nr:MULTISPECIES: TetR/AcrR family transcriptional regulator [unclassified Microbacterium]MBN9210482.1 TetR/AcrR family transcriptional regulator [Microbacterium sp.]OJV75761.1 MAG: hypothetical protein BGO45_04490 [Microbacterium sp. 71-36]
MTVAAPSARGLRTREAIIDAATTLFASQGFRTASLRDIAQAAGITHPGLRRHFASKDEILLAVVDRYETETGAWADAEGLSAPAAARIAEHHRVQPGYLATFTALAGEATATQHPAHAHMRKRYADVRAASAAQFRTAQAAGDVHADHDPDRLAVQYPAAWDGLQLLELLTPDRVSVVAALHGAGERLRHPLPPLDRRTPRAARRPVALTPPEPPDMPAGYASGRARRARIVADATRLYAERGYGATSMNDVAQRVGVSKSTLFHHYPTKETLLIEVLVARDRSIGQAGGDEAASAADALRAFADTARRNAERSPGLIEVHAVLSCEASAAEHPARPYFIARYRHLLDATTDLFRTAQADGDLAPDRDPAFEAAWLIALWDGLQIQWLYDRSAVNVSEELADHLARVLPR